MNAVWIFGCITYLDGDTITPFALKKLRVVRGAVALADGKVEIRNSAFEFLRIIAMLMVMSHHLIVHNIDSVDSITGQTSRFLVNAFLNPVGRIGVAVFIGITAWFCASRTCTVHNSLRKIWGINKQITFYSLVYFVLFAIAGRLDVTLLSIVQAIFPLIFGTWWFPTAFSVYMLLLPFFMKGLKALGRDDHRLLCWILSLLYSTLGFFPYVSITSNVTSLMMDFLVITAIVAYAKWYVGSDGLRPYRRRFVILISAGFILILICVAFINLHLPVISRVAQSYYDATYSFPASIISICIAVPAVFLAAGSRPWRSLVVNKVASLAFGTYLITDYGLVYPYLWNGPLALSSLSRFSPCFIACVIAVILVYTGASLLEAIRIKLFSVAHALWSDSIKSFHVKSDIKH